MCSILVLFKYFATLAVCGHYDTLCSAVLATPVLGFYHYSYDTNHDIRWYSGHTVHYDNESQNTIKVNFWHVAMM